MESQSYKVKAFNLLFQKYSIKIHQKESDKFRAYFIFLCEI